MPRIGYDITPLVGMHTRVGNYTHQLLTHMLALDGEHDFLLLSNRPEATQDIPRSTRVRPMVQPFPSRMHEVDLDVVGPLRSMTAIWMGFSTVAAEVEAGQLELIGDREIAKSMQQWLGLSPFAKEKSRVAA